MLNLLWIFCLCAVLNIEDYSRLPPESELPRREIPNVLLRNESQLPNQGDAQLSEKRTAERTPSSHLPSESTLPIAIAQSESILPQPSAKQKMFSRQVSESELPPGTNEATPKVLPTIPPALVPKSLVSELPTESTLPEGKPVVQAGREKLDRGELEGMLLTEEGETTPWARILEYGHSGTIEVLKFSPDGTRLYTAGRDKVIRIWEMEQEGDRATWTHRDLIRWQVGRGRQGALYTIAANDRYLALGGVGVKAEREVGMLDRQTLRWFPPLIDKTDLESMNTTSLVWLEDGERSKLIAADANGGLIRWSYQVDTATWQAERLRPSNQESLSFRPMARVDSATIAVAHPGSRDPARGWTIELVDVNTNQTKSVLNHQASAPQGVLALAQYIDEGQRWTGKNWNDQDRQRAQQMLIPGSGDQCKAMSVSGDGSRIAAIDNFGWLTAWDHSGRMLLKHRPLKDAQLAPDDSRLYGDLAWSLDGKSLFVVESIRDLSKPAIQGQCRSFDHGRLSIWKQDASGAFRIVRAIDSTKPISHLAVSETSLAHDFGSQCVVRSLADLDIFSELGKNSIPIPMEIQFSAELPYRWKWSNVSGQIQAFGQIGDGPSRQSFQFIDTDSTKTTWLDASAPITNHELLVRGNDYFAKANGVEGKLELPVEANQSAFSRYGCIRASTWIRSKGGPPTAFAVAFDRSFETWLFALPERPTGRCQLLRVFRGHEDDVNSLACSSDSRLLISAGQDKTIRIWPLEAMDGGIDADQMLLRKWGVRLQLVDEGLEVDDVLSAGPLYSRNLRAGDKIFRLAWTEWDPNTLNFESRQTENIAEIRQRLINASVLEGYAFWYRRGERELGFRRVCQWEPLMTQVVGNDREWAVWTPTGYYDASFNGDRLFGWQLNRGPGQSPDFFTATRFRNILERPDVLKNLLEAGNIEDAFKRVAGARPGGLDGTLVRSIALQPNIKIISPVEGRVLNGRSVPLRATITLLSGQTISPPKAFANGVVAGKPREVDRVDLGDDHTQYTFEWQALIPQDPLIKFQVFAATEEKTVGSDELVLKNSVAESPRRSPQVYLLASGISKYTDPSIISLDSPAKNALQLSELFSSRSSNALRPKPQVLSNENVTPTAWRTKLDLIAKQLEDNAGPDDLLIIYLSGHGVLDSRTREYRFLTYRARSRDLKIGKYDDCLSFSDLAAVKHIACRKLVILDTCHSGAIQVLEQSQLKAAVRALQDDLMIVMTATEGNQLAAENAFTGPLLAALEGKANADHDRFVSLKEVMGYVRAQMQSTSKSQFPTIGPSDLVELLDFPIIRVGTPVKLARFDMSQPTD